ncbi:MAG: NUDIX domain-containing protein [Caldilineaceae bacterium]
MIGPYSTPLPGACCAPPTKSTIPIRGPEWIWHTASWAACGARSPRACVGTFSGRSTQRWWWASAASYSTSATKCYCSDIVSTPRTLGLPGGWLNRRESVDQAWLREVKEETGLDAVVEGLVMQENSLLTLEFILWGRVTGGALALDGLEILDAQYFAADNLPAGLHEDHQAVVHMVFARRTVGMPRIKNRVMRDS